MFNKKILIFLVFFHITITNALSLENKILIKVDNEIITTVDVLNESKYIKAMNKGLEDLNENDLWKISINSITNEKIRMVEILNHIDEIKVKDENLKFVMESIYKKLGFEELEEFKNYLKLKNVEYEFLKKKLKLSLLSEIVFDITNDTSLDQKFKLIENEIKKSGFESAAFSFSISNSSKSGGNIGWVNEDTINQKLNNEIKKIELGQYTKPIVIPGGVLILKLEDIKEIKNEIDIDSKLNELIRYSTNEQLNQFSNIYFNKVKKNIKINEL